MGGRPSASAEMPELIRPMLATAGPVPGGPGWVFEFAWDGVRALADVHSDRVRLVGGSDRGLVAGYPELDVLPDLARRHRMLLDGMIVALDAFGRPSRSRLQRRMTGQRPSASVLRRVPVAYYVFDLLRLDDRSTLQLPYQQRRQLLEELDLTGGPVVLPPSFTNTDGQAVLDTAAQYGLHGVIAKRAGSRYQPGRRSRSWVETALRRTQEVVVGGWVPGTGGRAGAVGSLLVGVPTERGLRYVGQVGTGFTAAARRDLAGRLTGLERRSSPFVDQVPQEPGRHARWVDPGLLGEVHYRQWTRHGRLGQATWRGLRPGRHPATVQAPVLLGAPGPRGGADERELAELDQAVRRARAEVDALRAQIAPHFLYNLLSAIAAFVRTDPQRARELLIEFADFTRYSFRSGVELSTLAEELDTVERYLTLEQARLGDRLRVELQVVSEVLPVVVPFLAVQLVVESAVRHGIEETPGGGTVTVWVGEAGADCLVTVTDDGPGPDAARLVGLRTVDDRLRSAFGEGYRLAVDAAPGAGTRVSFRVPDSG